MKFEVMRIHHEDPSFLNFKLSFYYMFGCFVGTFFPIYYLLGLVSQMILLEGAKATTETVDALRTGAAAMKAMHKAT
jgi:hypothetical protein